MVLENSVKEAHEVMADETIGIRADLGGLQDPFEQQNGHLSPLSESSQKWELETLKPNGTDVDDLISDHSSFIYPPDALDVTDVGSDHGSFSDSSIALVLLEQEQYSSSGTSLEVSQTVDIPSIKAKEKKEKFKKLANTKHKKSLSESSVMPHPAGDVMSGQSTSMPTSVSFPSSVPPEPLSGIVFHHIQVKVSGLQHYRRHSHGIRHKVYRIELQYQNRIQWVIYRGAQDFVRFHSRLLVKRLKGKIDQVPKLPSNVFWSFRRAYERAYDRAVSVARQLSVHSLQPSPTGSSANRASIDTETRQMRELDEYLLTVLTHVAHRCPFLMCAFLECSAFTLNFSEGPEKLKEGPILKRAGGRQHRQKKFLCVPFPHLRKPLSRRWFVIGDNYVAYLRSPQDGTINELLLCDQLFDVHGGKHATGSACNIHIVNGYRSLNIRTEDRHQLASWMKDLTKLRDENIWVAQHPHRSFAPMRSNVAAISYVDGRDYFQDIAIALDLAKEEIYIADWWLSPYLHLVRTPCQDATRLDYILKRKAEQGVKVYVIVYKEFNLAFANNSRHTKRVLQGLHSNIRVLRHPDHSGSHMILKWTHHEKLVIIDQSVAFLGGLDLCYGRDDTPDHFLTDYDAEKNRLGQFWHGQDYSNPRLANVTHVDNPSYCAVDRSRFPRMPWHDISCVVTGATARDLARHFIQRWNFIKSAKAKNNEFVPFIVPKRELVAQKQQQSTTTKLDSGESKLTAKKINHNRISDQTESRVDTVDVLHQGSPEMYTHETLVNGLTQCSLNDTQPLSQPVAVEERDVLESPSPTLSTRPEPSIISDFFSKTTHKHRVSRHCRMQVLRSMGPWSNGTLPETSIHEAYVEAIEKAEYFIYIENQFYISFTNENGYVENSIARALFKRIKRAAEEGKPFRVIMLMPSLPGFQGDLDDYSAGTLRAITHWQYCSIRHLQKQLERERLRPSDYIDFYSLRNIGFLGDQYVTEQVYIHAKMMLVDDRRVIIGSANINDRSLIGVRDSEIAVLIEDAESVPSRMAGSSWSASPFALALRLELYREHLGEHLSDELLADPLSDALYQHIWRYRAFQNTSIYRDCFRCIPDNGVESWTDYEFFKRSKKHYSAKEMKEKLSLIKGHLVLYPTRFLMREHLGEGFSRNIYT